MGKRKRLYSENIKEAKKSLAFASLKNYPSSPRKMRLVVDVIRGRNVFYALGLLKNINKHVANPLEKLLLSVISNWQAKNTDKNIEDVQENLYIKEINVDGGRFLKRLQPAPQGRAHRIRKRSCHVRIVIQDKQIEISEKK